MLRPNAHMGIHSRVHRSLVLAVMFFWWCAPVAMHAQTSAVKSILVSDGVALDATVVTPDSTPPSGGFPGIVLVHGYGGNKSDMAGIAAYLAGQGYASISYSVRGQGSSGGVSTTMGPRETQDLLEVIQFFRSIPSIHPEKLGVAGGSQGGIHAWIAATRNMPGVKVVASLVGPPSFALDLVPNNCIKERLQYEITLSSVRFSPERDRVRGFIVNEQYDSVYAFSAVRDLYRMLDSVRIPVVQGLGWNDNLFPVNGAIKTMLSLSTRKVPIWSYFGTNGHGETINFPEYLFLIGMMTQWFNRWLQDSLLRSIDASPCRVCGRSRRMATSFKHRLASSTFRHSTIVPVRQFTQHGPFHSVNGTFILFAV